MSTEELIAQIDGLTRDIAAHMELTIALTSTLLASGAISADILISNLEQSMERLRARGADAQQMHPFLELRNWLVQSPYSL